MPNLKSHFEFDNQQRSGILLLCILIVGLFCILKFYKPKPSQVLDISSSEILAHQARIDSLRLIAIEKKTPKVYPFNPNFISDYKAYTLGMSPKEFDRLSHFRSQNQWINSVADFKRVTKVSDSLLSIMSPLFKFPDWIRKSKSNKLFPEQKKEKVMPVLSYEAKTDLNVASIVQLQGVYGIGPALSARIVSYRAKLGGFTADKQLLSVWGLKDDVVKRVLDRFTVKTPRQIKTIPLNDASASDIATIPGISFELAKEIWEYRVLHEKISSVSELQKIEGMTVSKYALIELYLRVD
jgi:competence protein ComEA